MRVAVSRNLQFGLMLVTSLSCSVLWPEASDAYTPEQQQACSGDAFRLCSSEIPDVDRVTACMIQSRNQLSPGCRVFFRSDDAAQGDNGGPAVTARRHVKPHRVKSSVKRDAT